MKRTALTAFIILGAAALLRLLYPAQSDRPVLRLYAGAGLRKAVEALIAQFEAETGITIEPDYGGSGMIMTRAREDRQADLFMPGDVWYVDRLNELSGNVGYRKVVSSFVPTIIVAKGNPNNITGLKDFFRPDLKVALGKADACQIGRVCAKIFTKNGMNRAQLEAKESITVNELGNWVKLKDVDAAMVWDALAANLGDVEQVEIPLEQNIVSMVVLAEIKTSPNSDKARMFIDFVAGPQGQKILQDQNFTVKQPYP